ncbi:MAG: secretin N-terminal domain-containing protein [Acidobacteriota bacterium]|nr:secretin N-terminal domain-containing protein [Acidobacteriota bacterium]
MKKIALILLAALSAGACVTLSPNYKLGTAAEMNRRYDDAIASYEKAALENPRETVYRMAAERARLSASLFHLQEARKRAAEGKRDEAAAEYRKVLTYNPRDNQTALEAQQLLAPAAAAPAAPAKIEFPIKLRSKDEPLQITVPVESSLRSIFLTLGKAAGINVVFDSGFRDVPYKADLAGQTFEQALKSLCQATKNFSRIVDERTVLVIPDEPLKRVQFEVSCIKTFQLSNIVAQDVFGALTQMLRSQFAAPNVISDKDHNSVTVRGTPEMVGLAEKLIRSWDKPKGEVFIDIEIMEVSRIKLRELGMNFSDSQIGLTYNGGTSGTDSSSWFNLKSLALGSLGNYSVTLPSAYLQLLETDSDAKIIAQPRLRGVSDEKITYKVGQKVPVPSTSYVPSAAGGYADNALTSYQYQDVGIDITLTPRVHQERDVTLDAEIKVTSLGGTGYGDLPIINNREVKNFVRLRDGETQLIAGLLRDEERKSISGIPGLKSIPGLGRLFGSETTNLEQTDVIMTITPYVIRTIAAEAPDAQPIWVDVDTVGAAAPAGGAALTDRDLNPGVETPAQQRRRAAENAASLIALSPANLEGAVGREFRMAVNVRSDQDINTLSLTVAFDPKVVTLKDVTEGGLSRQAGGVPSFLKNIDPGGVCTLGFSSQPGKGVKGGGMLATLLFEAKTPGQAVIIVNSVTGMSAAGLPIPFQTAEGRITVR